jgi:hypothetical protein
MIISGTQLKGVAVRDKPTVPNIVTAGLVYYIDAGNAASYSGSGITMTDISGQGYAVSTLVGGPAFTNRGAASYFSFSNSGQYVFTGDMIDAFTSPTNNRLTIETWVRTAPGANGVIATEQGTTPSGVTLNQGFHDAQQNIVSDALWQGVWDGSDNAGPVNGPVTRNVWQQYVMTYDSIFDTVRSYIDGGNVSEGFGIVRVSPMEVGDNTYYYGIMAADPQSFGDGGALAGDWCIFRAYTRALSQAEIYQNYLATATRFNT